MAQIPRIKSLNRGAVLLGPNVFLEGEGEKVSCQRTRHGKSGRRHTADSFI